MRKISRNAWIVGKARKLGNIPGVPWAQRAALAVQGWKHEA
jgi:hypothetical protein